MKTSTFVLERENRARTIAKLATFLESCLPGKRLRVTVEQYRRRRSDPQNSYLWAAVYPTIIRAGGEELGGWTPEDLHEYFLGNWAGWETLEGFGKKRLRPMRRSSTLTTVEFNDFVASIQRKCAEHGWYVPDPNEEIEGCDMKNRKTK